MLGLSAAWVAGAAQKSDIASAAPMRDTRNLRRAFTVPVYLCACMMKMRLDAFGTGLESDTKAKSCHGGRIDILERES
jgi:hypothetical protein